MKKIFYILGILSITAIASCKKDQSSGTDESSIDKIAPNGFDYKTTKDVSLNLTLLTNSNQPISGAVVSVYTTESTNAESAIFKGVTDANGNLNATINVATSMSQLIIDPAYVGLMRNVKANINSNAIKATIGGTSGYSGDVVPEEVSASGSSTDTSSVGILGLFSTDYGYPSSYSSTSDAVQNTSAYPLALGRPKYLETTSDVIETSLLSYINASLPEGKTVSSVHPEYLTSSAESNINITATSDVWVTYISEGATNKNTLAYYTYDTSNPPSRSANGTLFGGIDKVTIIFPNASGYGSGGGLKSGDKVKLGTFSAGTTVAFVLLQNAWTGSGVNTNATKFYTDSKFNPENSSTNKKHSVVLYDDVHSLYLYGFEDTNRESSADNDFNDLVFYASANPVSAISNSGVATIDKGGDSDGDGVQDKLDAYPNDATKAYVSYYPSQSTFAQIAFEDNWPSKGDYDMNDLVVNYRYTFALNASNQVVTMQGNFSVAASGASFHNGFGIQLPVNASAVKSVTGQQTISNYISFASNGVEAGQTKAVIIPFDNHEALIHNADYSYFINVYDNKDKVVSSTDSVLVTFTSPISISGFTVSSLNPFLISNLRREYEIHLPGYAPTDKANKALFGTTDDGSLVNGRSYYTSSENWPWAINFSSTFKYPLEGVKITDAYPHFSDWATSSGGSFTDWYSNTASGYRTSSKIYSK